MTDFSKTVTEYCNNCETEIEMRWNVDIFGYKAYCPVCGERLMLCDECTHREQDGRFVDDCDYDSETDTCRFNVIPKGMATRFSNAEILRAEERLKTNHSGAGRKALIELLNEWDNGKGDVDDLIDRYEDAEAY